MYVQEGKIVALSANGQRVTEKQTRDVGLRMKDEWSDLQRDCCWSPAETQMQMPTSAAQDGDVGSPRTRAKNASTDNFILLATPAFRNRYHYSICSS